jgi:hypothetical protein
MSLKAIVMCHWVMFSWKVITYRILQSPGMTDLLHLDQEDES